MNLVGALAARRFLVDPKYPNGVRSRSRGLEAQPSTPGPRRRTYPNPERVRSRSTHREFLMPQSLAQIYLHIVFSTKGRRPYLQAPQLRDEFHRSLGAAC